jgi:hypothetical protein
MPEKTQDTERRTSSKDGAAERPQHSAGPHATPELTDLEKTPGCGMLPEFGDPNSSPTS